VGAFSGQPTLGQADSFSAYSARTTCVSLLWVCLSPCRLGLSRSCPVGLLAPDLFSSGGILAASQSGMTWLELANVLFEQSKALSPRGAHLHLDTAGWLRTWTPHQNQAADAAARYFAQHLEWPPMEPEAACQLYFRCLFAIERSIDKHASGPRLASSPQAEPLTLQSLLIDAWHLEGLEWAERRYRPAVSRLARPCVCARAGR
jgi:hypothetical protein